MHAIVAHAGHLTLEPVAGPKGSAIEVRASAETVIGRSSACDIRLDDGRVSRRHATLTSRHGEWYVTDLDSRHGTRLNGVELQAGVPTALRAGDVITIEPWSFRVETGAGVTPAVRTQQDDLDAAEISQIDDPGLSSLAGQRLRLLMEWASAIHAATDERSLAETILDAAVPGTGFARGAVLRDAGGAGAGSSIEILAHREPDTDQPPRYSRTLISAACEGRPVCLVSRRQGPDAVFGQTVVQLGIHTAICAPIFVGKDVAALVYLDARGSENSMLPDAVAFCVAVTRIAGLALANIRRRQLEERQQRLLLDLQSAREAQRRIMPRDMGVAGGLRYALRSIPGRLVAGDLFDVVELPEGRVGVMLGDVADKGVGAGILMATAQSYLRASLTHGDSPEAAVRALNEFLTTRPAESAVGRFLSLWIGVIDVPRQELTYVDAGHGHWLIARAGSAERSAHEPDLLVGIEPAAAFHQHVRTTRRGERLILFSDGVTDQPGDDHSRFGRDRIIDALPKAGSPYEDVESIVKHLSEFAPVSTPMDDTTIASIELHP